MKAIIDCVTLGWELVEHMGRGSSVKGKVGRLGTFDQQYVPKGHFSGMCPLGLHGFSSRIGFYLEREKDARIKTTFRIFFLYRESLN